MQALISIVARDDPPTNWIILRLSSSGTPTFGGSGTGFCAGHHRTPATGAVVELATPTGRRGVGKMGCGGVGGAAKIRRVDPPPLPAPSPTK